MTDIKKHIKIADAFGKDTKELDEGFVDWVTSTVQKVLGIDDAKAMAEDYCELANFPVPEVWNRDESFTFCLLYTSPSPRDMRRSRMPSSA